jgi:hypothetical protein
MGMSVVVDDCNDDNVFRVELDDGMAKVMFFGARIPLTSVGGNAMPEQGEMPMRELPTWVQERIAVLDMLNAEPPTQFVPGVGRRISENVFWIFVEGEER